MKEIKMLIYYYLMKIYQKKFFLKVKYSNTIYFTTINPLYLRSE